MTQHWDAIVVGLGGLGTVVSHDLAVVGHMCDRLAVMQHGRILEVMDVDALRRGAGKTDYTRHLIEASAGYIRG